MQPRKLSVLLATFPYGGNGAAPATHPAVGDQVTAILFAAQRDERIERIEQLEAADTPIPMTRNQAVLAARNAGLDVVVMLDSDMVFDVEHGKDASAKKFFESSFDFLYTNWERGPHVVGVPYCGAPPEAPVFVFEWRGNGAGVDQQYRLEMIAREDAARRTGIEPVAALPTGGIMYDVRAFELIEPCDKPRREVLELLEAGEIGVDEALRMLNEGWFYYEWVNQYAAQKASTEDVTNTRDISLAGLNLLGYNPIHVNWDAWAGHVKPEVIGKPKRATIDDVNAKYVNAVLQGRKRGEKLAFLNQPVNEDVTRVDMAPDPGSMSDGEIKGKLDKILEGTNRTFRDPEKRNDGYWYTPDLMTMNFDLMALEDLVATELRGCGFLRMFEVGSWLGHSTMAIMRGAHRRRTYPANFAMHVFDHWQGSPDDVSGALAKMMATEDRGAEDMFRENIRYFLEFHDLPAGIVRVHYGPFADFHPAVPTGGAAFGYIDANHEYEAVDDDIRLAWPKIRKGGILAGHDYGVFPGVTEAVNEWFGGDVNVCPDSCIWWVRRS